MNRNTMRLPLQNRIFKYVSKKKIRFSYVFKRDYSLITSVNTNNWDNIHKEILQKIKDCDFISIDVEYTGLHLKDERYVSVDASYEAHCYGAKSFFPCQIGLTVARKIDFYNGEENSIKENVEIKEDIQQKNNKGEVNEKKKYQRWEISPYSIYVFPKENKYFSVSTTTLIFLKENNFDFNEWIFKGVSYLTPTEENEKKKFLLEKKKELQNLLNKCNSKNDNHEEEVDIERIIHDIQNNKIVDEEDKEPIVEIIKKIGAWLNKGSKNSITNHTDNLRKHESSSTSDTVNATVETIKEKKKEKHSISTNFSNENAKEKELVQKCIQNGNSSESPYEIGEEPEKEKKKPIPEETCIGDLPLYIEIENPYLRLLAHTLITKYFHSLFCISIKVNEKKHLALYKTEKDTYIEKIRTVESEIEKINKMIGVRLLFDEIIKTKKVIIGHNCFYDILHIYQTFYNELPKSINEFKEKWTHFFSYTFDTKYMNETHEHLQVLNGPATLKGLCEYMGSLISTKKKEIDIFFHFEKGGSNVPLCFHSFIRKEEILREEDSKKEEIEMEIEMDRRRAKEREMEENEKGGDKREIDSKNKNKAVFKSDEHNAGYDSLLTCVLFIFQCYYILEKNNLRWSDIYFYKKDFKNDIKGSGKTNEENEWEYLKKKHFFDIFSNMSNKIKLVKTQPNVISLTSNENSEMDRHFYMYDYPSYFKKWEIMKTWSPLWITLRKVDDQSCWIIAKSDEDAKNIKSIYKMLQNPQFKLCTYEEYVQKFKNS